MARVLRGFGWRCLAGSALVGLGLAMAGMARAADAPVADDAAQPAGRIVVMNRTIATLRSSLLGWSPTVRAEAAAQRIGETLDSGGELQVSTSNVPEGAMVQLDGRLMFVIATADSHENTPADAEAEAKKAAAVLRLVVDERRESRDLRSMLRSAGIVMLTTLVLFGVIWLLRRARSSAEGWLVARSLRYADHLRVAGVQIVARERLIWIERLLVRGLFWLLLLLLVYEWLSIAFAQFPFTRAWGEQLNSFLFGLLGRFGLAIVHAIPDLIAALLVFLLAYFGDRVLRRFFARVHSGQVSVTWLDADVALTTSRLCSAAVWLFALAMAYPYLPGSQTEAFKGLSVLLGLMISLGASNLVGQLASGLILTYTHTFRNGEYVRIAEHEGTVMNLGAFTTRVRTGLGEELTLSNSLVLGAVTKNYSRAVKGAGFVVDTTVTIGYDTPWRQVNELLVQAALRTPGVLTDPPPQVFQTALSDFYPEYRLVCQAIPSQPRPRAEIMSLLHANIQDLFNEYGVQIMSPHYLGDPAAAKVVPAQQWYAAPAKPPVV
jgi:small-conductance mechanosensitive channel